MILALRLLWWGMMNITKLGRWPLNLTMKSLHSEILVDWLDYHINFAINLDWIKVQSLPGSGVTNYNPGQSWEQANFLFSISDHFCQLDWIARSNWSKMLVNWLDYKINFAVTLNWIKGWPLLGSGVTDYNPGQSWGIKQTSYSIWYSDSFPSQEVHTFKIVTTFT